MITENYSIENLFLEKVSFTYCHPSNTLPFFECNVCEGGSAKHPNNNSGKYGWLNCQYYVSSEVFYSYGWGVCIIRSKTNNHYFFIDFRDDTYGIPDTERYEGILDIEVRYNPNGYSTDSYFKWEVPRGSNNWELCKNGEVKNIWKGFNFAFPFVDNFPTDFFENSIAVAPITPDGGATVFFDNPVVLWGKEQESNITKYRVYRAINKSLTPPPLSNFTWIAEAPETGNYYFKDTAINKVYDTEYVVHYYVESYSGNTAKNTTVIKTIPVSQNENFSYGISVDWSNVLMKTEENGHPRIVWAPLTAGQTVNKYKIYKNGVLFHVINSGTVYAYTDYSEWLYTQGNQKGYVNYKVKAYYNTTARSGYSNTVNYAINDAANKINPVANTNNLDYQLFQNYPNPSNPSTIINYTIPRASYVTLKVYNALGKEVVTLVNGAKEAGKHAATFDGSGLPSGVYFYALTAGEFTDTKKLILMK